MATKTPWVRSVADSHRNRSMAVLQMPNEGQPGGPVRTSFRSIVIGENPSDNVFVDWDVESQGHLLSNSRTAPGRIALFCLDYGFNEFSGRSLWTLRFDEKSRR